jgi:carboxyl-terminal processing protease
MAPDERNPSRWLDWVQLTVFAGSVRWWGPAFAVTVALTVVSFAGAEEVPTPSPTPASAPISTTAPRATPSPSPKVEVTQVAVPPLEVVRAAFDLLRQRYVVAVPPGALLDAIRRVDGSPDRQDPRATAAAQEVESLWQTFAADFDALARAMPVGANPAHVAVRRMTSSLNDCHTSFTPDHARDASALSKVESYGGIGAVIREARRFEPPPPGPVIVQVFEGSPAAGAGLRAGDAVIAVDDAATSAISGTLTDRVRGVPGTTVHLRVDRLGLAAPVDLAIERGAVTVPLVTFRRVEVVGVGPIGLVRFRSFAQPAVTPFIDAVTTLRNAAVKGWILDLRENGGGDLGVFERVASQFLSGPLAVTVERDSVPRTMVSRAADRSETPGSVDRLPVAVLVNGETASAAELLAGDFGDYGVGRLFGERTAGCFGTSRLFRLPDGSGVWITVSVLQTGVARRDVHRSGFAPTVPVVLRRDDLAVGRDEAVEASLAWLQERLSVTDGDPRLATVR